MKGGGKSSKASSAPKKADSKLSVKRKGAEKAAAANKKPASSKAAAKDPNMPKRPASAFFVFMEEFRKTFKEKHPANKSVAVVGKAGGEKWKSMSEADKAPYVAKAEKRKTEYTKNMQAYNKKLAQGNDAEEEEEEDAADDGDESDKSKSEINDEDDEDQSDDEDDDE